MKMDHKETTMVKIPRSLEAHPVDELRRRSTGVNGIIRKLGLSRMEESHSQMVRGWTTTTHSGFTTSLDKYGDLVEVRYRFAGIRTPSEEACQRADREMMQLKDALEPEGYEVTYTEGSHFMTVGIDYKRLPRAIREEYASRLRVAEGHARKDLQDNEARRGGSNYRAINPYFRRQFERERWALSDKLHGIRTKIKAIEQGA